MTASRPSFMHLSPADTVGIALRPLAAGKLVQGVTLRADIPLGHKFAMRPVAKGAPVVKYGQVMAVATVDIAPGDHVHSHNAAVADSHSDQASNAGVIHAPPAKASFQGYLRPDGRVGTRNFIGIMASVNCSSTV